MLSAVVAALTLASAAPSFDCAKASRVERVICSEPRLAVLDRRLARLYTRSLSSAPTEAQATRQAQLDWIRRRDHTCANADPIAACLDGYYRKRIQELQGQQRRRDESLGHAPTSGTFADFIGHWRVVGVTAADESDDVTNFATNEPRYMGLVLSAGADEVKWLNGSFDNSTTDVCAGPAFTPRSVAKPLPRGWKAVSLSCSGKGYWAEFPVALTLKARDLAELEWDDGAILHLTRVASGARTPPPPSGEPPPPLPVGVSDHQITPGDRAYFLELQSAVRRRDREWFARQGGVTVNLEPGYSYEYQPAEVRDAYDRIITPDVRRAILAQSAASLFKNWRGVMVDNGAVWFDQVWLGGKWVYRILAVNHLQ